MTFTTRALLALLLVNRSLGQVAEPQLGDVVPSSGLADDECPPEEVVISTTEVTAVIPAATESVEVTSALFESARDVPVEVSYGFDSTSVASIVEISSSLPTGLAEVSSAVIGASSAASTIATSVASVVEISSSLPTGLAEVSSAVFEASSAASTIATSVASVVEISSAVPDAVESAIPVIESSTSLPNISSIAVPSAAESAASVVEKSSSLPVKSSFAQIATSSVLSQTFQNATSSVIVEQTSIAESAQATAPVSSPIISSSAFANISTSAVLTSSASNSASASEAAVTAAPSTLNGTLPISSNATVSEAENPIQMSTLTELQTVTQVLGNNFTVTSVITNEQTVTASAVTATETQIIRQPTVIIVQQVTLFVFQSALGGICPAVQPMVPGVPGVPAQGGEVSQGGFLVGGQTFGQFQEACVAACNIQMTQCQSIVGPGINLSQCQTQFVACQGAASSATVTVTVPTTITQTVIIPSGAQQTDSPAVTSQIVEAGGQVITTTVLASDAVATIGTGGASIVTVTATATADAVTVTPEPVTSVVTVTLAPPAGQPDAPAQVSTATITLHPSAVVVPPSGNNNGGSNEVIEEKPHTSVVTITMGQQTGVITVSVPAKTITRPAHGGGEVPAGGNQIVTITQTAPGGAESAEVITVTHSAPAAGVETPKVITITRSAAAGIGGGAEEVVTVTQSAGGAIETAPVITKSGFAPQPDTPAATGVPNVPNAPDAPGAPGAPGCTVCQEAVTVTVTQVSTVTAPAATCDAQPAAVTQYLTETAFLPAETPAYEVPASGHKKFKSFWSRDEKPQHRALRRDYRLW